MPDPGFPASTTLPFGAAFAPRAGRGVSPSAVSLPAAERRLRSPRCLEEVERWMQRLAAPAGIAGSMAREHLATGGKRLRARLALAVLDALGAERSIGVAWAAACEMLHNATLIHDDLQDGDRTRRGRSTTWMSHGAAQAVTAGDLLLMLPYLAVDQLDASAEVRCALAVCLATYACSAARGQAEEIGLRARATVDWEDYRTAVTGKTSALFLLPAEGSALLAECTRAEARALATGFEHLGLLFQMQDDVLDLYGNKGRGETGSDLREGKISALVVEHLALHPEDAAWLRALLALPRDATPEAEVGRAMDRFRTGGALRAVLGRIDREAEATLRHPAFCAHPALGELATELVEVALAPISHVAGQRAPTGSS